jgi:hypothetical protein
VKHQQIHISPHEGYSWTKKAKPASHSGRV